MRFWAPWSLIAVSACTTAALVSNTSTACVAQTGSAEIVGHNAAESEVCEFLGIAYASPPVGNLRFAPPVPGTVNGSFTADHYGFDCPQNTAAYFAYPNATEQYRDVYAAFVNQLNNTQSEDCLALNVWSKANISGVSAAKKPVLVFIHGGRFSGGTSNTPFYRGDLLANAQDVVVVTFNFRMNIFGTSFHEQDSIRTVSDHICCRIPRLARDHTKSGLPGPIHSRAMGS